MYKPPQLEGRLVFTLLHHGLSTRRFVYTEKLQWLHKHKFSTCLVSHANWDDLTTTTLHAKTRTDATEDLRLASHTDDMVIALLEGGSHAVTP